MNKDNFKTYFGLNEFKYKNLAEFLNNETIDKRSAYYFVEVDIEDLPDKHCFVIVLQYQPLTLVAFNSNIAPGDIWISTSWNKSFPIKWIKLN